jgi:hypothetical protein
MQERQYAIFRAMTPEARMHLAFELSDALIRASRQEEAKQPCSTDTPPQAE